MYTGKHRFDEPWVELTRFIETGDATKVEWFVNYLAPVEMVSAVGRLDGSVRSKLLPMLSPALAARVIDALFDAGYEDINTLLKNLTEDQMADLTCKLPSNYRDNLLRTQTNLNVENIINRLPEHQMTTLRFKLAFPPNTAGDLMSSDYLWYDKNQTVHDVLVDMRAKQQIYAEYNAQYAFVTTGQERHLVGVLPLRDLLFSESETLISDLCVNKTKSIPVMSHIPEMREYFEQYRFIAAPVVDDAMQLLGVVLREDVERVIDKQSNQSLMQLSGFIGGEEMRSMTILQRCKRRISFLSINVFLACIACSAISIHEETLAKVIALAVFLPVISDMCGCAGHQAVAVSIRELTMGLLRPREVWRVLGKELSVGAINGVVLGTQLALVAWWWKGNPWLGVVVGAALAGNTLISCAIGGVVPLLAARFKIDPALVSGVILTAITDLCGFFMVFGFASILMSKLL